MLLVVFGHALIGASTNFESTQLSRFLLIVVYGVHMPVLFVLTGGMCGRLIVQPLPSFTRHMLSRIVWPYLLWSNLLLATHFMLSEYTNRALATYAPWRILWNPPAVMWFLYVLLIALLIRRALGSAPRRIVVIAGGLFLIFPYIYEPPVPNFRFVGLFLLASTISLTDLRQVQFRYVVWICAAVAAIMIYFAWFEAREEINGYPADQFRYLPAMLISPVLIFASAKALTLKRPKSSILALLRMIGRHSMAVFVLHILFTAGTRIVLVALGADSLWFVTLTATCLGLAGPLALALLARNLRISSALGWQAN